MSSERPLREVTWETIDRVADEAELSRLQSLSKEELAAELRQSGIEPEEVDQLVREAVAKGRKVAPSASGSPLQVVEGEGGGRGVKMQAPVRGARSQIPWGWRAKAAGWAAATAAAAGVIARILVGTGGGGLVETRAPRDSDLAVELRAEAATACQKQAWAECEEKLNKAREKDPRGESDPRVVEERKAIAAHLR